MLEPLEQIAQDCLSAQLNYQRIVNQLQSSFRNCNDNSVPEGFLATVDRGHRYAQKVLETALLYLQLGGGLRISRSDSIIKEHITASDVQQVVARWVETLKEIESLVRSSAGMDSLDDVLRGAVPTLFPGGSLSHHEGGAHGGHAISRHIHDWVQSSAEIGWQSDQLEEYLRVHTNRSHHSSLFRISAEQAIGEAIYARLPGIRNWAAGTKRQRPLRITHRYDSILGLYKERGKPVRTCREVVVVLAHTPDLPDRFRILTVYANP